MVKKYHHGGSHGYTSPTGSYGREEQAFAGESNVQQESYDPGHKSESDKGSSQENKGTGETGSSGHSILDALNKLTAEGKGDTEQAKVYERYLVGVEQKYQSEGKSLYPDLPPLTTEDQYEQAAYGLSEWEKIQKLAGMEAADPKYLKSWEGQQMKDAGYGPGTKEWRDRFGMPSIITTGYTSEEPIKTTVRTDEYGQEVGGKYIYSGLGKTLMDQYDQPGFDYGTAKDAYWDERTVQDQAGTDQSAMATHPSDGGGGGGTGYYGDPRQGNPIEQMANFFTPQANLQQAMVNVHGTPTVFAKRGGIVSLLRLS